jgi:hypothetical protein
MERQLHDEFQAKEEEEIRELVARQHRDETDAIQPASSLSSDDNSGTISNEKAVNVGRCQRACNIEFMTSWRRLLRNTETTRALR